MTPWASLVSWEIAILALVGVFQVAYLGLGIRLVLRERRTDLSTLKEVLERDIVARARRGVDPDWLRYAEEAHHVGEHRGDDLRDLATAALATGIGGTILLLSLHLLFPADARAATAALEQLLAHLGMALCASLAGVVVNVITLRGFLPWANRRFRKALEEFQNALRAIGNEHPPTETLAEAVRSQLGEAFRDAVKRFPEAFATLDRSVKELGGVIQTQTEAINAAEKNLSKAAAGLGGAGDAIMQATADLSTAVGDLGSVPSALAETLRDTKDEWTTGIRKDQQRFLDGIKDVLAEQHTLMVEVSDLLKRWENDQRLMARQLTNAVSDVSAQAGALPAKLAGEVQNMADTLGREFGAVARNHVADLIQDAKTRDEKLRDHLTAQMTTLRNDFLNRTSDVVGETIRKVYEDVEKTLLAKLAEVGDGLREAMAELPDRAKGFAGSLSAVDRNLQSVGGRIGAIVGQLDRSVEHLREIADNTRKFEDRLIAVFGRVSDDHLAKLHPVVASTKATHETIREILDGQVDFIERLLERAT